MSDIIFATHYLCLGGYIGAVTIAVDTIYLLVMYLLDQKNKTEYNPYVTICATFLTIWLLILTWGSELSLLPMFSMLTYLTTMIFRNVVVVKAGALGRNTCNVIYMII